VSLKELESWLKRGQYVRFLREICPQKKCTPKSGANIGAITGILLSSYENPLYLKTVKSPEYVFFQDWTFQSCELYTTGKFSVTTVKVAMIRNLPDYCSGKRKKYPQLLQLSCYGRHITATFWGYIFFGRTSPSKIGHIAPFLATCLLIKLKVLRDGLYESHLQRYKPNHT
jgi:hypothetical protein